MSILDLLLSRRSQPPPLPRCAGCEARDKHIGFLQEEVRIMRDEIKGLAQKVFVAASSAQGAALEEPLGPQTELEAAEQETSEMMRAEEREIERLSRETSKPRAFFSDVP